MGRKTSRSITLDFTNNVNQVQSYIDIPFNVKMMKITSITYFDNDADHTPSVCFVTTNLISGTNSGNNDRFGIMFNSWNIDGTTVYTDYGNVVNTDIKYYFNSPTSIKGNYAFNFTNFTNGIPSSIATLNFAITYTIEFHEEYD